MEYAVDDLPHVIDLLDQSLKDLDRLQAAAVVVIEQHKLGELTEAAIYDLENAL